MPRMTNESGRQPGSERFQPIIIKDGLLGKLGMGLFCSTIVAIVMNFAGLKWLVVHVFALFLSLFGRDVYDVKPKEAVKAAARDAIGHYKGEARKAVSPATLPVALPGIGQKSPEQLRFEADQKEAERKAGRRASGKRYSPAPMSSGWNTRTTGRWRNCGSRSGGPRMRRKKRPERNPSSPAPTRSASRSIRRWIPRPSNIRWKKAKRRRQPMPTTRPDSANTNGTLTHGSTASLRGRMPGARTPNAAMPCISATGGSTPRASARDVARSSPAGRRGRISHRRLRPGNHCRPRKTPAC